MNVCEEAEVKCEKCGLMVKKKRLDQHNCFLELKEAVMK